MEKDLEEKTRQLLDSPKEVPEEPKIPHWAERIFLMSLQLGFYKGERKEASNEKSRYLFEDGGFTIDYIMHLNPNNLDVTGTETYVFDNNLLVLRATNNDIDAYLNCDWQERLDDVYLKYFTKVPEVKQS